MSILAVHAIYTVMQMQKDEFVNENFIFVKISGLSRASDLVQAVLLKQGQIQIL